MNLRQTFCHRTMSIPFQIGYYNKMVSLKSINLRNDAVLLEALHQIPNGACGETYRQREREREREHTGSHHLIPAVTAIIIPMNADLNTNISVVYHFLPLIGKYVRLLLCYANA